MAYSNLYEGFISSSDIITAIGAVSASNIISIVSSNGQQVLMLADGGA